MARQNPKKVEPARVVVADPPWRFGDSLPGETRGASKNYATMPAGQIESFPLPPIADDAILFMWRVSSMVPEAYRVIAAWGFEAKSEIVWLKKTAAGNVRIGMGRYVRNVHETCIIARRGKMLERKSASIPSVFDAPTGAHSAKPEKFFEIVESLYDGPYVELFARRTRPGWTTLGNEVDKNVR